MNSNENNDKLSVTKLLVEPRLAAAVPKQGSMPEMPEDMKLQISALKQFSDLVADNPVSCIPVVPADLVGDRPVASSATILPPCDNFESTLTAELLQSEAVEFYGNEGGDCDGSDGRNKAVDRSGFADVSKFALERRDKAKEIFLSCLAHADLSGGPVTAEIIQFHMVPRCRRQFNHFVRSYGCTPCNRPFSDEKPTLKSRKSPVWHSSVTFTPEAQANFLTKCQAENKPLPARIENLSELMGKTPLQIPYPKSKNAKMPYETMIKNQKQLRVGTQLPSVGDAAQILFQQPYVPVAVPPHHLAASLDFHSSLNIQHPPLPQRSLSYPSVSTDFNPYKPRPAPSQQMPVFGGVETGVGDPYEFASNFASYFANLNPLEDNHFDYQQETQRILSQPVSMDSMQKPMGGYSLLPLGGSHVPAFAPSYGIPPSGHGTVDQLFLQHDASSADSNSLATFSIIPNHQDNGINNFNLQNLQYMQPQHMHELTIPTPISNSQQRRYATPKSPAVRLAARQAQNGAETAVMSIVIESPIRRTRSKSLSEAVPLLVSPGLRLTSKSRKQLSIAALSELIHAFDLSQPRSPLANLRLFRSPADTAGQMLIVEMSPTMDARIERADDFDMFQPCGASLFESRTLTCLSTESRRKRKYSDEMDLVNFEVDVSVEKRKCADLSSFE